jgi:hypothetical protein
MTSCRHPMPKIPSYRKLIRASRKKVREEVDSDTVYT